MYGGLSVNKGKCKEKWKKLPDPYSDYEVSDLGRVKSSKFRVPYLMKPFFDTKGYLNITLSFNNKKKRARVHRLVMSLFVGESDLHVNHKNGIKTDNRLENLEYCTPAENNLHGYRNGLLKPKAGKLQTRLSQKQAKDIFLSEGHYSKIAVEFQVVPTTVSNIKKGKTWSHITKDLSQ